jgi:hypothetical protein
VLCIVYFKLEKLQALGWRPVLFLARPGKKKDCWHSEVLAPLCHLSERSSACLERMKALFDLVIEGNIFLLFLKNLLRIYV